MNKCQPYYKFESHSWVDEDSGLTFFGSNLGKLVEGCVYEDISLHSYKCKKCGFIGYYSKRGEIAEKTCTKIYP
jgi:hypothetical protein